MRRTAIVLLASTAPRRLGARLALVAAGPSHFSATGPLAGTEPIFLAQKPHSLRLAESV